MLPKIAILAASMLVGCAGQQASPPVAYTETSHQPKVQAKAEPARPLSPQEWCASAIKLMGHSGGSYHQKQALLEMARNRGCFDRPKQ
jgi:hypothetical protein